MNNFNSIKINTAIRLVTSWATSEVNVLDFIEDLKNM